jgi:hypothetical protein
MAAAEEVAGAAETGLADYLHREGVVVDLQSADGPERRADGIVVERQAFQ